MKKLVVLLFLLTVSFAEAFDDDFGFNPKEGEVFCYSHTFKSSGFEIQEKCDPTKGEFEDDELALKWIIEKCEANGDKKWIFYEHSCVDINAKLEKCYFYSEKKRYCCRVIIWLWSF